MSEFKVFLTVATRIGISVAADDADSARARVAKRIVEELSDDQQIREVAVEPSGEDCGKILSAEEIAYCNGRGYGMGHDTDAFEGLQWSHIVDDAVAICRTNELWFSSPGLSKLRPFSKEIHDDNVNITCPFCAHLLTMEMRYSHLWLKHWSRHNGKYASAKVDYRGGDPVSGAAEHVLLVNGVEVARLHSPLDHGRLFRLAEKINGGPARPSVNEGVHGDLVIEMGTDKEAKNLVAAAREEALFDALHVCRHIGSGDIKERLIDQIQKLIDEIDRAALRLASPDATRLRALTDEETVRERENCVERCADLARKIGAQEGHALELWVIDRCIEEIRKMPAGSLAGTPPETQALSGDTLVVRLRDERKKALNVALSEATAVCGRAHYESVCGCVDRIRKLLQACDDYVPEIPKKER